MAVGDVVSQMEETGTWTFQPAAGVTVCVTRFMATGSVYLRPRGDIDTLTESINVGANSENYYHSDMKYWAAERQSWFIDNGSYFSFYRTGGFGGFTGIQTA